MSISLTKHVRILTGGSQPHLMQAVDGNFYVVKFQKNPQGTTVLANELLAAKIAAILGLPIPSTVVVDLSPKLSEGLYFETPGGRQPIRPGLHLGSRLVVTSVEGRSYDRLPRSLEHLIRNPEDLVGIELFDLWTCNRDTRQTVFWRYARDKKYTAAFIDNGHCFGGPEWKFSPLVLPNTTLTKFSTNASWSRWSDLIAHFPIRRLESNFMDQVPPEWCRGKNEFKTMFEELRMRRAIIAEGISNHNGKVEWIRDRRKGPERISWFMDFDTTRLNRLPTKVANFA